MPLSTPANKHVLQFFDLSGKVAIVTGGAGGIGLEVVRGLAEAGANVALLYSSSRDALEKAENVAAENKIVCKAYKTEVTDAAQVQATVDQVVEDFGRLDIMIANAGTCEFYPADDCTPEQFSHMMKVNLDGAFYCAQSAARAFKKQQHTSGSIVFTASVSASIVNVPQKQAAYNTSKAAVVHLAKSLAVEWTSFCRVNCISPGYIETELLLIHSDEVREQWNQMIPARRNCNPYELKGAYLFLASEASSYITGANIIIDGGYTVI